MYYDFVYLMQLMFKNNLARLDKTTYKFELLSDALNFCLSC